MTVIELVGVPAVGKTTLAKAVAARLPLVRTTMTRLDHDVTRRRRAIHRALLAAASAGRHPVWAVVSLIRIVRSGQDQLSAALRLWPNLLVVSAIVDRAKRSGVDELLDQGPQQFLVSARLRASRPEVLERLVPDWAAPDVVLRAEAPDDVVNERLSSRTGRSRADADAAAHSIAAFADSVASIAVHGTVDARADDAADEIAGRFSPRRLRIDHVITWLDRGGAQQNTLLTVEGQRAAGHEVGLLHGSKHGDVGALVGRAASCGADEVQVTHLRQEQHPLRDLAALVELSRILRRRRPDVVHTHSSKAGVVGRLAARIAGVPVVVHTVHGWSFHDHQPAWERRLAITLERLVASSGALVILAENDRRKGRAAQIGKPDDYRLIRSGIDLQPFRDASGDRAGRRASIVRELGLDAPELIVGSVTRLSEQKDPRTLVDVAARVTQTVDAHFVVVGDGPLEVEIRERIRRADLDERVHLLGSRDDVPDLVAGFDVFLLTSLWEGLPRVVPEAMAAHTPVIATDVDGTSEIVHDGQTGLLIPPSDVDVAAAAVHRLAADPGSGLRMAANAAQLVEQWDAPVMIRELDDLYRTLLHGAR